MKDLTFEQTHDVNGGIDPVTAAIAIGFVAGFLYEMMK